MRSVAPEAMRVRTGPMATNNVNGMNGVFILVKEYKNGSKVRLHCIVDDGEHTGWEHVSVYVSGGKRLPNWCEMCMVKDKFWQLEEAVVQYHPKASEYVNNAEVLHLWKQRGVEMPTPPSILVGV